jgi:hypothetical protein
MRTLAPQVPMRVHGQLFTSDFLREGIRETPGWTSAEERFVAFRNAVSTIFSGLRTDTLLNEAQTEDEIIAPVLDAQYFNLCGLDRIEAAYVLDTFPIVREHDEAQFNRYRTKDLVLGYMNALAAGDTDTVLAL